MDMMATAQGGFTPAGPESCSYIGITTTTNTGATLNSHHSAPTSNTAAATDSTSKATAPFMPRLHEEVSQKKILLPPNNPAGDETGFGLALYDSDKTLVSPRRALSKSPSPETAQGLAAALVPVTESETQPNASSPVGTTRSTRHSDLQNSLQRDLSDSSRRHEAPPSPPPNNSEVTSPCIAADQAPRGFHSTSLSSSSSIRDSLKLQQSPPSSNHVSSSFPSRRRSSARSSFGATNNPYSIQAQDSQDAQNAECSPRTLTSPENISPHQLAPGQRELLLPKSLSQPGPTDDRRATSYHPPVSYKPPINTVISQPSNTNPVRVPPIRAFRSSGSRKSLTLDMNYKGFSQESGDESNESGYDYTLRTLEGRQTQDKVERTPPTTARHDSSDADDGGDVFLRIAREEAMRRIANNRRAPEETQGSASRATRSHRRPLSSTVATYQPESPPFLSRRLSDQQEPSSRRMDDTASDLTRTLTQRSFARDKAMSAHPAEDTPHRPRTNVALRPSPLTPRSSTLPDTGSENPFHTRRRSSITEQTSTPPTRSSTYRTSGTGQSYGKHYNSSPLVRSFEPVGGRNSDAAAHGVEGTESTTSTTAPSTVWDELDDLKSRIHRLELTGKLPSTSAAAVSRLIDERPPTATTTVTTASSSPKRAGGGAQINDAASTTVAHQESYPVLHAALSKSRPFLNTEIYRALEAAATDAMTLSSMMGSSGQPGPISSGASAIGSSSTVTDRQLRRKADSVCRSLTELCVALGEDVAQSRPVQTSHSNRPSISHSHGQQQQPSAQEEVPSTPTTVNKTYNGLTSHKRSNTAADGSVPRASTSNQSSPSRTMSKFEERRNTLLHGSALPSPRASGSGPPTPQDNSANRRSSLLVSRSRRALTEEPEEVAGRRSSLLLRSRRGGTEEPEEGRQTSLLLRNRRGTVGDGDDVRMSAPSRAYTEVNSTRGAPTREYTEIATSSRLPTRDYLSHGQQEASPQTSTLPRRRYVSTNTAGSRLATPSTTTMTTATALPTRKYFDRQPAPERDDTVTAERREHRYSLGATTTVNRGVSLKSKRQSMISSLPTAAATSYR